MSKMLSSSYQVHRKSMTFLQLSGKSGHLYFRSPMQYIVKGFDFQRTSAHSFMIDWKLQRMHIFHVHIQVPASRLLLKRQRVRTELTRERVGKKYEEK